MKVRTLTLVLCCLFLITRAQTIVQTKIYSQGAGPTGKVPVKIYFPSYGRYVGNLAPVVIYIQGGNSMDGITPLPPEEHLVNRGFIEIQLNFPGGTDADGIYDNRGPFCMTAVKDIVRFAMGLNTDTAGKTLSLYSSPVLPIYNNVGLVGNSNGGNIAISTAGFYADSIPNLAWILNRESPVGDGMPDLEAGAYNTSGNPVLNPAYNDTTGDYTYSFLKWDDTVYVGNGLYGGFYFDINNDFVVNWGSDYVIPPYTAITQWGQKSFQSVASIIYAYNNGIYPAAPPSHLPDSIQTKDFWSWRNGEYWIDSVVNKIPQLMFMVFGTDTDHAQSALDHPHVLLQYERFRLAGTRFVRLNPDRSYVEYILGTTASLATDNPAFIQYDHLTIRSSMEPDHPSLNNIQNRDSVLIAAGSCELADRIQCNDTSAQLNNILSLTCITNVSTIDNLLQTTIYPNPVHEDLFFLINHSGLEKIMIKIFNLLGQEVFQSEIKNSETKVHLDMENGIYVLRISYNGFSATKKIQINK